MDALNLTALLERLTWELQRCCEARGYPRIRIEGGQQRTFRLIAESDTLVRVEVYFPYGTPAEHMIAWAAQLPFPPGHAIAPADRGRSCIGGGMATVSDAPSGQAAAQEYRCHWRDERDVECNGLLLRSRDNRGVLHAVYCPKCRRRTTVFLGGRKTRDQLCATLDDIS